MGTTNEAQFRALSSLRGLSPEQLEKLHARALYNGTGYVYGTGPSGNQIERLPWEVDTINGRLVPAVYRKPLVQVGKLAQLVEQLDELITGEAQLPSWAVEGPDADELSGLLEGLELSTWHASRVLEDLALLGASCEGFRRRDEGAGGWPHVYLDPVWCTPIFAWSAQSAQAQGLAAEVRELTDAPVFGLADPGAGFAVPEGSRRDDDLVALEWLQPVIDDADERERELRERGELIRWQRRIYTPWAIIRFADIVVRKDTEAIEWKLADEPEPHGWGVVPLVWHRAKGGDAADKWGRPLVYSPDLETITEQLDYTASFWVAATKHCVSPTLIEKDVTDRNALAQVLDWQHLPEDLTQLAVGPKSVASYSSDASKNGEVFFLETDGAALEKGAEAVSVLIQQAHERSRIVRHDPQESAGVQSGVALERMQAPTVATVGKARHVLERGWLRLAEALTQAAGLDASVSLAWPKVFELTAADVQQLAGAYVVLVQSELISRQTAIEQLAPQLGVEDPEAEAARVLAEAEAALASRPRTPGEGGEDDPEVD